MFLLTPVFEYQDTRGVFLESSFVKAAAKSEIPLGKMKMVKIEQEEILVANVNGTYYAIGNSCRIEPQRQLRIFKCIDFPRRKVPHIDLR